MIGSAQKLSTAPFGHVIANHRNNNTMFSVRQKREIADAVQKILRDTNHPELPSGEIKFQLHIIGEDRMSWADIQNNGSVTDPEVNPWNEQQDPHAL